MLWRLRSQRVIIIIIIIPLQRRRADFAELFQLISGFWEAV